MAFKKSLAQRLFNISKISSQSITNCRISSSSVGGTISTRTSEANIAPDPGDNGVFRRFLHKRTGFQPELRSAQIAGNNIVEKLREMDIARNRIRLDGITPPAELVDDGVTVEDARKLLKVAQLEMVKSRLRDSPKSCVTVSEFIRICSEYCSDQDQAVKIAKMLDDSAAVIILGDIVFLRPEQVNPYLFLSFIYLLIL